MKAVRRVWMRLRGMFAGAAEERRLAEEFAAHEELAVADLMEQGVPEAEARRQARREFGGGAAMRERYRDQRGLPWLEFLAADVRFGWRQLWKHRTASAAAIVSLALATGACMAAFRLVDALLLRQLPVAKPQELYSLARAGVGFDGKPAEFDGWAFPAFQLMREAVKGKAELMAVSFADRMELTYGGDAEIERATVQYVSGWMFPDFGLRPAAGRLLTEADDRVPGGHPVAVVSHTYWKRRLGGDAPPVGKTFRLGGRLYEIVGVAPEGFTGTEPGVVVEIFLPTMMFRGAVMKDYTWHRTLLRTGDPAQLGALQGQLHAVSRAFETERLRGASVLSRNRIDQLTQRLVIQPAGGGVSGMQSGYRRFLGLLGVMVGLVLLIACVNAANLMTAQAGARAREMAIRVSIGAGRWRLIRLVLAETALVAVLATALGVAFSWWAAPFLVRQIETPSMPVWLDMPADGRVVAFGFGMALLVTMAFGLLPALRASEVRPASALKGGENPHARRRTMHALIAAQVAFCFVVLFLAGLFAQTFARLSSRPLGFTPEGLLLLDVAARDPLPRATWEALAVELEALPGVESAAISSRMLLGGQSTNSFISVAGRPPSPRLAYFVTASRGWIDTMGIRLLAGERLPAGDAAGQALVNEAFVKEYFGGGDAVGKRFLRGKEEYQVAGVARNAPYGDVREEMLPAVYISYGNWGIDNTVVTVRVRDGNPQAMAAAVRSELARSHPSLRIRNTRTQQGLVEAQTLRERLLAMIGLFFAVVAAWLAGLGLYGVLDYAVLLRRKEIGIRMAIGADGAGIARLVTRDAFAMTVLGGALGAGGAAALGRYIEPLLYGVKAMEPGTFGAPLAIVAGLALAAAWGPVRTALRIDPLAMLRAD